MTELENCFAIDTEMLYSDENYQWDKNDWMKVCWGKGCAGIISSESLVNYKRKQVQVPLQWRITPYPHDPSQHHQN